MAIHMSQRELAAFYERFPHLRTAQQARSQAQTRPHTKALESRPSAQVKAAVPALSKRTGPEGRDSSRGAVLSKTLVVWGAPVGKPRQTRSDRWKKRPEVLRYRAWADEVRRVATGDAAQKLEGVPLEVRVKAYFALPKTWSAAKRRAWTGKPHQSKPDWDNVAKSVCDALFAEDKTIWAGSLSKFWEDGKGARIEIEVVWEAR